MHVRLLLARRMYLLLIDARRDKEGQGGWKERHSALLELVVMLFCTALLSEKQDRIVDAECSIISFSITSCFTILAENNQLAHFSKEFLINENKKCDCYLH